MKYYLPLLFVFLSLALCAQDEKKEEGIKKNWNFGALPAITFDTDLGFQYGALVNLFDYGDGTRYPRYDHSLYFEVSRFTKGSSIYNFTYNSDRLINGIETTADFAYLTDQANDFYGYNGFESYIHPEWIDTEDPAYRTRMFYKYDQKLLRLKLDVQGNLTGERLRWTAGVNFQDFKIGSVNTNKLNKGKEEEDKLPSPTEMPGLYERYQQWGIIGAEEADGGIIPTFRVGLVLDTRDNRPNPMKGIATEILLETSPKILGAESSFTQVGIIHRQYFTLIPRDLSLAYRLGYQATLSGDVPFYYRSHIINSVLTESASGGLGGKKTLRGIRRYRVVGEDMAYGNVELRWKFARFDIGSNHFYLGMNAFTDFGKVTKKVDVESRIAPVSSIPQPDYFRWGADKMHYAYGAGLRIAMNENFIVAADYGMAADSQDGDSGFYMGLNYLF
ncbi:MAG: BamA/TamA family outer membrane protein [Verrucomicrobia bacterium]|nr:BamA/TamA family outer membrane protein [Prolixibacteraceae bacterium]